MTPAEIRSWKVALLALLRDPDVICALDDVVSPVYRAAARRLVAQRDIEAAGRGSVIRMDAFVAQTPLQSAGVGVEAADAK